MLRGAHAERVHFWRRHTRTGVFLSESMAGIFILRTVIGTPPAHPAVTLVLASAVAASAPLLLLLPLDRIVGQRWGLYVFDAWEAAGILLIAVGALFDGGACSPYVLFLLVLMAHAALAYPPTRTALAGCATTAAYLAVALTAGGVMGDTVLEGVLIFGVATVMCTAASHNQRSVLDRTASYADEVTLLADQDGLTGCLNHRAFTERLHVAATVASTAHPLSVLMIDVDEFKAVNDTHGHPAGDAVLQLLGDVLLSTSRPGDAPGRMGGDEFALLLPATPTAQAAVVAERIRQRLREAATRYGATVSIGLATTTVRATGTELLARADHAVYTAKQTGRDRVTTARPLATGAPR